MKLLFLCQEAPFRPVNGVTVKAFNLLTYMAARHECHVLAFGAEGSEGQMQGVHILGAFPPNSGSLLRARQFARFVRGAEMPSALRWWASSFGRHAAVAVATNRYDLVHFDMINMYPYRRFVGTTPSVLSINDSASRFFELSASEEAETPWRKHVARRQQAIAGAVEREQLCGFDAIHVVSEQEKEHLVRMARLSNVRVVPIGVEDGYLELPILRGDNPSVTVLASGNMGVRSIAQPLVRFLAEAWPIITHRRKGVRIVIVGGRKVDPALADVVSQQSSVELVDWVDNYVDIVARSDIGLFLDARAGGMKNRVLQALAAGRAVVASEAAVEGILGRDGTHYLLARDAGEARERLEALITEPRLRLRIGTAARNLVRTHYSHAVTGEAWERLYEETIANRAASRSGEGST